MTLQPTAGMTNLEFWVAVGQFWKALKRPNRCPELEYLTVPEWLSGIQHAHALIRVESRLARQTLKELKQLVGLRVSVTPIKTLVGAVNYLFKHTNRPERKAELTPASFHGRMVTASRDFLTKPLDDLWKEFRDEAIARRRSPGLPG